MGARLVSGALQPHWARTLTPLAHRLYAHMCMTALDKGTENKPPGLYWAGIDAMILALRGEVPQEGSIAHATASREVRRHIRALLEAGAVERVCEGRRGARAEFRVTPFAFSQPSLLDSKG